MNTELLVQELRRDEGVMRKPYKDTVGKLTIGVGRNLDDVGLSDDEMDYLLKNDIKRVEADLDRALPWWREMSPNRQRVLANMCFNMGLGNSKRGLLSFRNTLEKMRTGDYAGAARGMLASQWARQVKGRAHRLADLMRAG